MFLATVFAVTLLSTVSALSLGKEVAFYAVLDSSQIVKQDAVVVYKYVTLNEGGGYNNVTGIFTSPKGGIYVFQINAMPNVNKSASLHLYQNDKVIVSIYLTNGITFDNTGTSAIVRVNKGDTFFVKTFGESNLVSSTIDHYTTFSCFLI